MARHSSDKRVSRTDRHQHWRTHVDAQARDTLSQRAYCQAHELAYSSFTYWRRRLQNRHEPDPPRNDVPAPPRPSSAFVPVSVCSASATPPSSAATALVVVLPGGVRLEGVSRANLDVATALAAAL